MLMMPMDRIMHGFLDPGSINYYETIIKSKGQVVIEMTSCLGDMEFGYSQDYDNFLNEKYEFQSYNTNGKY